MRLFRTRYDRLEEKLDELIFNCSWWEGKLKQLNEKHVALEKYLGVYVAPMSQPTTFEAVKLNKE